MNQFSKFLDAISGGGRSVSKLDMYMPDWHSVTRQESVLPEMRSAGEAQAGHACTCKATDCDLHFTTEATWLTPAYFRQYVTFMLAATLKANAENTDERAQEMCTTISIYLDYWKSMSDEMIVADPRYRAYEIGFNGQILNFIVQSLSFRTPKY